MIGPEPEQEAAEYPWRAAATVEPAQCRPDALPCGADLDRAQLNFAAFSRQ